MTPSWPAIRNVADLSGPFVLLAWGWLRWKRDPFRSSLPRWRAFLCLLSLLVGSAGAILFAAWSSGHARAGMLLGLVRHWPITFMRLTLATALAGFILSFANRGLTRFLVSVGCLWVAILSWAVCCMPRNMDFLIDWLERVF